MLAERQERAGYRPYKAAKVGSVSALEGERQQDDDLTVIRDEGRCASPRGCARGSRMAITRFERLANEHEYAHTILTPPSLWSSAPTVSKSGRAKRRPLIETALLDDFRLRLEQDAIN